MMTSLLWRNLLIKHGVFVYYLTQQGNVIF